MSTEDESLALRHLDRASTNHHREAGPAEMVDVLVASSEHGMSGRRCELRGARLPFRRI
jgi:hypothetical protein